MRPHAQASLPLAQHLNKSSFFVLLIPRVHHKPALFTGAPSLLLHSHIVYTFNPKLILLSVAAARYYACDQGVRASHPALCILSCSLIAEHPVAHLSRLSSRKRITPSVPHLLLNIARRRVYMQYQMDAPRFKLALACQSQASRN
jgi:hypothetical protein